MLSQFSDVRHTPGERRQTLADYIDLPDIYPAGRLDLDSEGLLLLTDDGQLQHRIANPGAGRGAAEAIGKTYVVQVEGVPSPSQLSRLETGVQLSDGPARARSARLLHGKPGWLWPRPRPVSPRQGKSTSWLEIVLTEGRNRQVRRMTAAVGLPTLRLVRTAIGKWSVEGLQPGEWKRLEA